MNDRMNLNDSFIDHRQNICGFSLAQNFMVQKDMCSRDRSTVKSVIHEKNNTACGFVVDKRCFTFIFMWN